MIRYVLMCLVLVGIDLSLTGEDPKCKMNCSCCVNQLCENTRYYDNVCLKGCIDGYTGDRCYIRCAEYCKACYRHYSNNCTKCYEGFYNGKYKNCSEECPAGCKACKSQESCSECNEGYYNGKEFDFERSTSLYNCTHRCRETCTQCMSYNNCTGCVSGAFGTICEQECSVGCVNNACQQSTGNCLCKDNFRGQQCTQCAAGRFGKFCDRQCPLNCMSDTCDRLSGNCFNRCITDEFIGSKCNDCVAGKYGIFCNKSCPTNCIECSSNTNCSQCFSGFYSHNCLSRCPCDGNPCEQIDGTCIIGKGTDSGQTYPQCEKVTNIRMVLGFSISIVLLLICIAILVIILLKRTRPCQRHRKQQNQGDVHVKTKVEMTEISATEAENVEGCGQTSFSEKPYEDLHEESADAGREHQYLEIAIQNEDSTSDPEYHNTPQNSEVKIKLCKI